MNLFLAQLWNLNDEMKLENKKGRWKYQTKLWTLPAVGTEGHIEDQHSGLVAFSLTFLFIDSKYFATNMFILYIRSWG